MKTLLLMRHAKAASATGGQVDWDRPLNQRGQRDAPRIGQWLRQHDLVPDLVISSTARRAVETAAAVIAGSGFGGEWQQAGSLYAAEPDAFWAVLQSVPAEINTVLVVAHNPGIEEVIEALSDEAETMATGAVAQITLPIEAWPALDAGVEGQLGQIGRPRELT